MNDRNIYWMNYSISITKQVNKSNLCVGAILVSERNEMLCAACSNEECYESWCSILLHKAKKLRISTAQSVYVTVNTLSADGSFSLNDVLNEICVREIYIGLPDMHLANYSNQDPVIMFNNVYRYPDNLKLEIMELHKKYFADSMQSIKCSSYYSDNRISSFVVENLNAKGFNISVDELVKNKKMSAIASLICKKYKAGYQDAYGIVSDAISEAFNFKYGKYSYVHDARSIDLDWKKKFMAICDGAFTADISNANILNVGVGGGQEALNLFFGCKHVTFVDIAKAGLKNIKKFIPLSKVMVSSADNLSLLPDNSYDLYVSLRTYNSSFFNVKEALLEARRVLKSNAVIIISVANGFLYQERECIISGLIIPGTEFVDLYRGLDTIKSIQNELLDIGFDHINLIPTNTEIYLTAMT